MTYYNYKLDSYENISDCLTYGRNKNDRPIPNDFEGYNNTRLVRIDKNTVGIKLYNTIIVKYHDHVGNCYRIELDSGGWKTVTTRNRMNVFQNHFNIWQEKFIWYIEYQGKEYLFKDKMVLFPYGSIFVGNEKILPYTKDEQKKINKLKRQINNYCKKFIEKFFNYKISQPDGGDCWYCYMFNKTNDVSHILSHMKESYYVPSLLNNAINENKNQLSIMDRHNIAHYWKVDGWESNKPFAEDMTKLRLKKVLKRYINKRMELLGIS